MPSVDLQLCYITLHPSLWQGYNEVLSEPQAGAGCRPLEDELETCHVHMLMPDWLCSACL